MPRARRLPFDITVDERTDQMSEAALLCRASGHVWVIRGMSRRRCRELVANGLWEWDRYCDNGCGSTWRQEFHIRSGQLILNERKYPTNGTYLMKPGTGRMHRDSARVAHFARSYRNYV